MNINRNADVKNVLCIRADNMGDLIMSTPAFRALKETFDCKLTVLTSSMGALITPFITQIDNTIIADVPWVKTNLNMDEISMVRLVQTLTSRAFDAAIIFTVYSQNPLPAAMLAFLAGIPVRVAYCRENPYQLLTHWIPDEEPYNVIQHQVERDLKLVASLGAYTSHQQLSVSYTAKAKENAFKKLEQLGVNIHQPYLIFHPGVSEEKRKYPVDLWIETGKQCLQNGIKQIVITGSDSDKKEAQIIQSGIGQNCYCAAALFTIEELIAAIDASQILVSVNTGTVHIAAALQKPVVVLYALTNPQHTPWQTPSEVLYFSVSEPLKSKNKVVSFVSENRMQKNKPYPSPNEVATAVQALLSLKKTYQ